MEKLNIGYSTYRFVEEVKDKITDQRITQSDVAAKMNCSRKRLNEILNSDRDDIKLVTALSLCKILKITIEEFCRLTGAF